MYLYRNFTSSRYNFINRNVIDVNHFRNSICTTSNFRSDLHHR
nr:MAG TPA: hypothetical protein [Crassvirales sp.]